MNELQTFAAKPRTRQASVAFETGHYTLHEGRARFMNDLAARVAARSSGPVLDIGCGAGYFLRALRPLGIEGMGLDVSPKAVAMSTENARMPVALHDANEPWPFLDGSFGAVTMFDVIEHLPLYGSALWEARRVLRHAGSLFIVTVNRASILRVLLGRRWGGGQDPDHVVVFGGDTLKRALRSAGFLIREYRTFFNLGVAGEASPFLKRFRRPGWVMSVPEFGDSIYVRADRA